MNILEEMKQSLIEKCEHDNMGDELINIKIKTLKYILNFIRIIFRFRCDIIRHINVLFLLFVFLLVSCSSGFDVAQKLIEYNYDFDNFTSVNLHSIFEQHGFRPVGNFPSWNKKIIGTLCSLGINDVDKQITLAFYDYKKYKQTGGELIAIDEKKRVEIKEKLNELYGEYSLADFNTIVLYPTKDVPLEYIDMLVPAWELSDRTLYLLEYISFGQKEFYLTIKKHI
ncbi:hypothetical protein FACS189483_03230 [Spirochaetia bacterium]|nr:hypothetical protein FACS189483_03230 [Spirochaetia bacterium]